jgi:hypothetical protein
MSKLMFLWRALESVPGLRAIDEEWRRYLRTDFAVVQHCLIPTNEIATVYSHRDFDEPMPVADLGNGAYSASTPSGSIVRELKKNDLIAYRLDIKRLGVSLIGALGWPSSPIAIPSMPTAYELGRLPVEYGGHPVFFGTALDSAGLCEIIDAITARVQSRTFLLLIPTKDNLNERVNNVLARTKGQLVTCDEIFRLTQDGKLHVSTSSKTAIGEIFGVKPSGNIFKRNGEGDWTVAFDGVSMPVKHVNGLSYIAILLGNPDIDFRVQDIDEQVTGVNSAYTKGTSDPLSTHEALRKIDERLEEAVDELETAQRYRDFGTIEARQLEIDALQQEKKRCTGLGGKIRDNSDLKKMTKRVARNIETAIKSIRKQNKKLGDHLDCFIDRGLVLKYQPNEEILWIT